MIRQHPSELAWISFVAVIGIPAISQLTAANIVPETDFRAVTTGPNIGFEILVPGASGHVPLELYNPVFRSADLFCGTAHPPFTSAAGEQLRRIDPAHPILFLPFFNW
jgi:hypothetical protein